MKALAHSIQVTARIEFTKRELELLINATSYENRHWAECISPNSYQGGVSLKEMTDFLNNLKGAAQQAANTINMSVKEGELVRD